jgi:hypothetical protein
MDMRFGTWNIRSLYRAGSLMTVSRELSRPRRRWIDNIKMDLLEIGLSVVDWICLAQDRYSWRALVNSVMKLRVPLNAGNYRLVAQLVAKTAFYKMHKGLIFKSEKILWHLLLLKCPDLQCIELYVQGL